MYRLAALAAAILADMIPALSQNPYLPLWEYIPDGEPYVFEDPDRPGHQRVYIYGSHDTHRTTYCGTEQVVWSAPVENLCDWRYDGVIFTCTRDAEGNLLHEDGSGDTLYAPDVAVREVDGKKLYFFYPNVQGERNSLVAVSERPDGPFVTCNWRKDNPRLTDGVLGFDPAVFVDDDGRVYGYWGFERSYAAELDPLTMCTVRPGTEIIDGMIGDSKAGDNRFMFYEASSIRKIEDKYVFIYSRKTQEGEFGLPSSNYTLAYAYGDSPLGPWTYGGTLIDARARDVDPSGKVIATAVPYGNTHGSLVEAGGRWWVFYHRQTGTDEYSRQAMVAPVEVKVQKGKGGKVVISEGEYTSEGFRTGGLDPLVRTPAGLACYLLNPEGVTQSYPNFFFSGSYVKPTRAEGIHEALLSQRDPFCPVVNNTSGSIVGYKYFNFDAVAGQPLRLTMDVVPQGVDGEIAVLVGGPSPRQGGRIIATVRISSTEPESLARKTVTCKAISGKAGRQPLYFAFSASEKGVSICELHAFQFSCPRR